MSDPTPKPASIPPHTTPAATPGAPVSTGASTRAPAAGSGTGPTSAAATHAPATHGRAAATHKRRHRRWESMREPLLPAKLFRRRFIRAALAGLGVIAGSLLIGVIGYHATGPFGWLDALYNASMILGGMGPVDSRPLEQQPAALKLFASFYALYSGVALLTSVGVMFAPVVHRVLHKFHLERASEE